MLKVVYVSGQAETTPKKLTAKQRQAKDLEKFMEELNRDRSKAALRMTEELKTLLK